MITGQLVDGIVELTGKQGTTWEFEIELWEDTENTIPFVLVNYQGRGQFRRDRTPDSPLLIEFTCTVLPMHATTNPNTNKLKIRAEAQQSSDLNKPELRVNGSPVLKGVFDIEVYSVENNIETDVKSPLSGVLIVIPEITRP